MRMLSESLSPALDEVSRVWDGALAERVYFGRITLGGWPGE